MQIPLSDIIIMQLQGRGILGNSDDEEQYSDQALLSLAYIPALVKPARVRRLVEEEESIGS